MAQTINGVNIALIAQAGFAAFKAGLAGVSTYSTNFSADAAKKSESVTTRIITAMSAGAWSSTYETGDTQTTAKTVTLNQHSFRSYYMADVQAGKTEVDVELAQAAEAGYSVAKAVQDYVWALFVEGTYAQKVTVAVASFDADVVADLVKVCNDVNMPMTNRSLFLSNAGINQLQKDNAIQNASALGSDQVIREGSIGRLLGCDVYPTNAMPTTITDENTYGWISHPSAMAVAARPVVPQGGPNDLAFEVVTDDETGLSLGYRNWYSTVTGKMWSAFEVLYGATAVQGNGLVRLESS